MSNEEKIIPYDSPEAASIKTVTGWVSRLGHFWGNHEDMARYDGCTHKPCETCRSLVSTRSFCKKCAKDKEIKNYNTMPRAEWNGTDMLYSQMGDRYFQDIEDLADHCEENDVDPKSLRLIICEPIYLSEINEDYWRDDLAEDQELPGEVIDAISQLNEAIRKQGPVSWHPGKFAPTDESIALKKESA